MAYHYPVNGLSLVGPKRETRILLYSIHWLGRFIVGRVFSNSDKLGDNKRSVTRTRMASFLIYR